MLLANHLAQMARAQTLGKGLVQAIGFDITQISLVLTGYYKSRHITDVYMVQNQCFIGSLHVLRDGHHHRPTTLLVRSAKPQA